MSRTTAAGLGAVGPSAISRTERVGFAPWKSKREGALLADPPESAIRSGFIKTPFVILLLTAGEPSPRVAFGSDSAARSSRVPRRRIPLRCCGVAEDPDFIPNASILLNR
jgi:hypothetical protein